MSDKVQTDVVIVGGGINGLLTAYYLVAKEVSVILLEKTHCFSEASWAGAGILSAMQPWNYSAEITDLIADSQKLYPSLCETLLQDTGIDPEFYRCGMLFLNPEQDQMGFNWLQQQKGEYLDKQRLLKKQYLATDSFQGAYLMPDIANVCNPKLGQALLAGLKESPYFNLYENTIVQGFNSDLSHKVVTHVLRNDRQQNFESKQLLFCNGAWLQDFLSEPESQKLMPIKGEMLLYKTEPFLIDNILMCDGRYIVPRKDGYVLVGSTQEQSGFDKSLSDINKQSLKNFAESLVPELANLPVLKHWSGLRPASESGLPIMGRLPNETCVFMSGGGFRNGIAMAPAIANKVTQFILND